MSKGTLDKIEDLDKICLDKMLAKRNSETARQFRRYNPECVECDGYKECPRRKSFSYMIGESDE